MNKLFFTGIALLAILFFTDMSSPNDNGVMVNSKDTQLPNWQWTSGDVPIKKTAAKQFFTITFDPKIYRPRDSIKITFTSYKVSMTGLPQGATFGQWRGKMSLVYFINNNWLPIVADTNDRINRPFSGKKNVTVDSLNKYSLFFLVPLSRTLTITAEALSLEKDNIYSGINPGGPMLSISIKGIEVRKLH